MEAARQPVGDCDYGDAGDVYGGAGLLHRQRGAAAYCGVAGREQRRGDLGADQLPGVECDYSAGVGVPDDVYRAQEVLHDLRGAVRDQLHAVRAGAVAGDADVLPRAAGRGRRRAGAVGAGDPGGYFFAEAAGAGVCDVWAGGGVRAGDRADAGRVDHGQLQLALDLLHQRAGGDC